MKRKVAQIGPSTLMVSLPMKWVKENNVSKGDELDVSLGKKEINFALGEKKKKEKEITIDISNYDRYLLDRNITILYRNNYDKIILNYKDNVILDHKSNNYNAQNYLQRLSKRFIGVEIVSQTDKRTEMACFILKDLENLKTIERRIYFLLKETINSLMNAIDKDFLEFDKYIYDHHDNIVKFINYYLRVIDRLTFNENEKKQIYAFYIIMDKLVDKVRHLSNKIAEYGCTSKVKYYLKDVFGIFFALFNNFYLVKFDSKLIEERYKLMAKIDAESFTIKEMRVIKEIDLFLNVINDFSETILLKQLVEKD